MICACKDTMHGKYNGEFYVHAKTPGIKVNFMSRISYKWILKKHWNEEITLLLNVL